MNVQDFLQRYEAQLTELLKELDKEPLPELTEELFGEFEKNGNRLRYEDAYFGRRKQLTVFALAVLLHRRPEEEKRLQEILWAVCEEECWALPAHVDRSRVDWRQTVDLFAAETAQTLAEITARLGAALPEKLRQRIAKEIERRVFTPFFTSARPYADWEGCNHNWNAVCMGSIGLACLYQMQATPERLAVCLKRITESLPHYLEGFSEDGVCMEGIGYYTYGMSYYTAFAEQLERFTEGRVSLLSDPRLKRIALFQQGMFLGTEGLTVSFSDGETKAGFRLGLTLFLARHFDGVAVPALSHAADLRSDPCFRFLPLYRDILWTKQAGDEAAFTVPGRRHTVWEKAQWSICECENDCGMAVKGGCNAEPHNHNDVGSFLYEIHGEVMAADLGAGEYTKDYFGSKRYEILCNSSLGHSVPLVDGEGQQAGEQYAASRFFADGNGTTVIGMERAYEAERLETLTRRLTFSLSEGSLSVSDFWRVRQPLTVTERLVTQCEVVAETGRLHLRGKHTSCVVNFLQAGQQKQPIPVVTQTTHKNHEGGEEQVNLIDWTFLLPEGGSVFELNFFPEN